MNDHPVHQDDIAALRREGDLKAYMRGLLRPTKKTASPPPTPRPTGRPPGAWPIGSSPPGPAPERSLPAHVWDQAVQHYRNTQARPDQPCDCGNCPPKEDQCTDPAASPTAPTKPEPDDASATSTGSASHATETRTSPSGQWPTTKTSR